MGVVGSRYTRFPAYLAILDVVFGSAWSVFFYSSICFLCFSAEFFSRGLFAFPYSESSIHVLFVSIVRCASVENESFSSQIVLLRNLSFVHIMEANLPAIALEAV